MSRTTIVALAVLGLGLVACGAPADEPVSAPAGQPVSAPADDPVGAPGSGGGAAGGTCPTGTVDCVDTVFPDQTADPVIDVEQARAAAQALLGTAEATLPDDVRVGRRGAEQMMLTEDYMVGRMTVELDPDADGTFRVTTVTIELPDGPETITS